MNVMEIKLIDAFAVLILADKKTIEDVPEKYRDAVELRKAERVLEMMEAYSQGQN